MAFSFHELAETRAQLETDAIKAARALARAVDTELLKAQTLGQGLSLSESLARGDLAAFHRQASHALQLADLHAGIVLSDRAGREILDSLKDWGDPLPQSNSPELVRRVFESGKPQFSEPRMGSMLDESILTIAVPVLVDGKTAYALSVSILPDRFDAILSAQNIPAGWIATFIDQSGSILASNLARYPTAGGNDSGLTKQFALSDEGVVEITAQDGTRTLLAFAHSSAARWGIGVGIPGQALRVSLTRELSALLGGEVLLFSLGLGLAWLLGERIARSFRALRAPASALGAGEPVTLPVTEVSEAVEVIQAIGIAAGLLQEREAALLASEAKYRTLFSNMTEGFALGEPVVNEEGHPVDFRFLEANEAFYVQTGIPRGMLGRPVREYLPNLERYWTEAYIGVALTGRSRHFDKDNAYTGRHYDVFAFCPAPGRFAIIFRDVTEQKALETALQESEARLRELVATLPGMVWSMTPDGAFDFLSQRWYDYTGTTRTTPIGRGAFDCLHGDDLDTLFQSRRLAMESGESFDVEFRLRRHDGVYRWFKCRGTPFCNESRQITRWLGVLTDIHDLKTTQAALTSSQAELLEAQRLGKMGTWYWEASTDVMTVTDELLRIYARNSIPPFAAQKGCIYPLPVWQQLDAASRHCLETGAGFHYEVPALRGDGQGIWVAVRVERVCAASGEVLGLRGIVQDISERKEAEKALRLAEARFRCLCDNNLVGVVIADADGGITEANDYFLNLLGEDRAALAAGRVNWRTVTPAECLPADEEALVQLAATGSCAPYEKEYLLSDGRRHSLFIMAARLPEEDGKILALILDITDRKRVDREIERLNADLENRVQARTAELIAANRELEGFTFATSHDLKGPLGRISSFSAMLEQQYGDRLDGDARLFLNFICQNALRLSQLVDDMLDHARVSQQALALSPVDLSALAASVLRDNAEEIADARAVTQMKLSSAYVLGDAHALAQALTNLLRNALKFSNQARPPVIEIGGELLGDRFRLWVGDNGIGFDMAYHDKIFEMFGRLHGYSEYHGSGIGLALVKRAMERLGGRVWAESAPGQGARFFLELNAVREDLLV